MHFAQTYGMAMASLANGLLHSSLTNLSFQLDKIDYTGLQSLLDVLPETNIRTLSLRRMGLDDGACARIAAVLPSSTIVDLDLSGNHLTDRSADELCRVIQSDMALMSLRLSHTRITLPGETDLKKALAVRPQLKIFLDESGTPIKAMDQDDLVKIDF
ncbi:unnamed protein product [Aphanomyces euteiches]